MEGNTKSTIRQESKNATICTAFLPYPLSTRQTSRFGGPIVKMSVTWIILDVNSDIIISCKAGRSDVQMHVASIIIVWYVKIDHKRSFILVINYEVDQYFVFLLKTSVLFSYGQEEEL